MSKPTVAFYGASTVAGTTYNPSCGGDGYYTTLNSEPADVQRAFPNATIENHGVAGLTAYDLLNGTGGAARNWWEEMAASKADVVVVNIGLNDAYYSSIDTYTAMLGTLIDIAQNAGKTVVVETNNPTVNQWMSETDGKFAMAARDTAQAHGAAVVDQWSAIQAQMPDWQQHLPDGTHPDDAMYRFEADQTAAALAPYLGAMPEGYELVGINDFQCGGHTNILIRDPTTGDLGRLDTDNGMAFEDVGTVPAGWDVVGTADVDRNWTTDILFHDPATGWVSDFAMGYDLHPTWGLVGWAGQ